MLSLSYRTVPCDGKNMSPCLIRCDDHTDTLCSAELRAPAAVAANENSFGITTHVSIVLCFTAFKLSFQKSRDSCKICMSLKKMLLQFPLFAGFQQQKLTVTFNKLNKIFRFY